MNQEEYIEKRIEDQIKWYSEKSVIYQKKHKRWQVVKVIAALIIPILVFWIDEIPEMKYIIGVLGGFIAFIESYLKIYNFKELWSTYRMTSENLKREKFLFLTKAQVYQTDSPFELFVTRCEHIMKSENTTWDTIINQNEEK